jgi:NAD(P)-dependent dehydrogenase (short-subunit alcohol dehydrogenase family)
MSLQSEDVWLITGCSSGFGRELAKLVLNHGWCTVVTARDPSKVKDLVVGHEGHSLALRLDVTDAMQVDKAVKEAEAMFGHIDVLVNNAGYGYVAAIEESQEDEVRAMFETNFFGLARMVHAVLSGMRRRRHGYIVNMSSIGGLITYPSLGYYDATKHAVEGFSETLSKEIEPLSIRVLIVEPGPFRTGWAGRSIKQSYLKIDDYAETAGANRKLILDTDGQQPGNPTRAAEAIVKAMESPEPPLRLVLGRDALEAARTKLDVLSRNFDAWEEISRSVDFTES